MILSVSFKKAIIFFVFVLILQTIEANLIAPHVVGSSIGLPSVWVLASVTVFGSIWGIVGMLLGVPITTTVYKILRDYTNGKSEIKAKALGAGNETGGASPAEVKME